MAIRRLFLSVMAALLLVSCGENEAQKQAEAMLEKAGVCYEQGQYNEALTVIDSLRKVYPNARTTTIPTNRRRWSVTRRPCAPPPRN